MVKDVIKVSTVAFNAKWGDKEKNLNRMKGYIEAAASEGANLIVFPEMALTGYDDEEDKAKPDKMQSKLAEVVPGPSSEAIAELTKKLGVYVAFGMPERDEKDSSIIYNAACVCGPEGVIGAYRKIHLPLNFRRGSRCPKIAFWQSKFPKNGSLSINYCDIFEKIV